jgi:hypothetical protein
MLQLHAPHAPLEHLQQYRDFWRETIPQIHTTVHTSVNRCLKNTPHYILPHTVSELLEHHTKHIENLVVQQRHILFSQHQNYEQLMLREKIAHMPQDQASDPQAKDTNDKAITGKDDPAPATLLPTPCCLIN